MQKQPNSLDAQQPQKSPIEHVFQQPKPQEPNPKTHEQNLTQSNNSAVLSVSQSCYSNQKQQKQSSNDGLNSERSYPSSLYNQKDKPHEGENRNNRHNKQREKNQLNESHRTQNSQALSDEDEDSKLKYHVFQDRNQKAKLTFMKLILIICKKQYAFEIIRIMMYALISITVFAYILDQNKQKKQFYEAFYSSQQITISKQINGVFPPLFGSQLDITNRTWILQTYNSQLKVNDEQNEQPVREQLFFEFTPYNVLYIKTNNETCVQQLKFKWKVFDYNMRITEVIESEFEKIDGEEKGDCFPNKRQIEEKMREVSLWTIDWESKQLYLLSEPFRDEVKEEGIGRFERWNELIVLKKQSANV